jgi:hypothetical protein
METNPLSPPVAAATGDSPAWPARLRYRLRYAAEAAQRCWKQLGGARRNCGRMRSRSPLRAALAGALLLSALTLPAASAPTTLAPPPPNLRSDLLQPFGLGDVGLDASPAFADLDADGDLDGFIGERWGDTFYFQNHPVFRTYLPVVCRE